MSRVDSWNRVATEKQKREPNDRRKADPYSLYISAKWNERWNVDGAVRELWRECGEVDVTWQWRLAFIMG